MLTQNIPVFFPQQMKTLNNWVLWKLQPDANGRNTKVPYSALYDGKAQTNNPETWTNFDKAQEKLNSGNYSGLGFVFSLSTHLVFIDIDHCIDENGVMNSQAVDIIQTIGKDTYIELSQSGSGLHIIALGEIPKATKHNGVEMYSDKRFVAMTGRALSPCEPSDKHSEILEVYRKYKTPEKIQRQRIQTETTLSLSDNDIIKRASENKTSGETFRKLMSGDISDFESHSNADFKLCQILAFWSDRDIDTIERIFSSSGLTRDKWERPDYRERTITQACNSIDESISEFIARKKQEEASSYEKCIMQYDRHFRGGQRT